jgi:ribosome-associated heat shock protein Hsp15
MSDGQRLDKFLWFARFAKTRSLAARLIETGAVLLDGRTVKPHYTIHVGDHVFVRRGRDEFLIVVRALGERRGPAAEARLLYEERERPAPAAPGAWEKLIQDEAG